MDLLDKLYGVSDVEAPLFIVIARNEIIRLRAEVDRLRLTEEEKKAIKLIEDASYELRISDMLMPWRRVKDAGMGLQNYPFETGLRWLNIWPLVNAMKAGLILRELLERHNK